MTGHDGFDGDALVEKIMAERIEKIMTKYRNGLKAELPEQRAARAREIREVRTRCRALIKKLEEK